jgi:hypothetical protein
MKSYNVWVNERDNDELDLRVVGLKAGETYTLRINGIKHRNSTSYRNITKSFIA